MNRRSFLRFSSLLLGSAGLLRHGAASEAIAQARGKLMWDPVYLDLPAALKAPWDHWLALSECLRQNQTEAFARELAASGRKSAAPARVAISFEVPQKPPAWFAGADARRIANNLRTWQAPCGGWTKNTAMARQPRAPGQRWSPWGEWEYVGTIDNKATTSQLEFLARTHTASGNAGDRDAVIRGLRYLLNAQMPSGGWPQVFPLQGSYHDQITFNDDAMIHVLTLLRNVKNGKAPWQWVDAALRAEIDDAVQSGIDCILKTQIKVNGQLTAWCAQHHPISLLPVGARAYELASISGAETVDILRFLMSLANPAAPVRDAIEAGTAWLRRSQTDAARLGLKGTKGPQWARFYEIETNRPLFSDPDGQKRYSFSEVKVKKKTYAWFTPAPGEFLSRDYPKWKKRQGG